MRSFKFMLVAALVLTMSVGAFAELQMVSTSGSLRIRGNNYDMDGLLADMNWVEMRTRLGVQADFTDSVSAVIELDSYDVWGEDFRSNYLTSGDARAASVDDVEVYQAKIIASEMWGTPLQLTIGRQEIMLGSEWLMGNKDTAAIFTGLSFDGVRATYAVDTFSVDAIWAKLAETGRDFGEDDVDLYGVYASYLGFENAVIDAYWLYVREVNDTLTGPAVTFAGGILEDDAALHTFGLRGAGTIGAFDYEAEIAYQTGEIEATIPGLAARILGLDNDRDYDEIGANLEVGYTFDMNYTPRVYLGAAYFGGGDVADTGGHFGRPGNDMAFNRLFSDWEYSEFIEDGEMSNAIIYRAGMSMVPTESLELSMCLTYFEADNATWQGHFRDEEDTLGWELGLYATYTYSDDLAFNAGYAHFFGDDGLGDQGGLFRRARGGNFVAFNGIGALSSDNDDDYDYLFIETEVKF